MKGYYGPALYHFRSLQKTTQESLAKALNMSRQNLSKMERNQCQVSDEQLAVFAPYLKTTVKDIKNFNSNALIPPGSTSPVLVKEGSLGLDVPITVPVALFHALMRDFQAIQREHTLIIERETQREREREREKLQSIRQV